VGADRSPIVILDDKIKTFGDMMRERLTTGEIPFREAYLGALIDRAEVDDHQVRIMAVSCKTGMCYTVERNDCRSCRLGQALQRDPTSTNGASYVGSQLRLDPTYTKTRSLLSRSFNLLDGISSMPRLATCLR
jgi:hypothetical protein